MELEPVVDAVVPAEPVVAADAAPTEIVALSQPETPCLTPEPELTLAPIAAPELLVVAPEPELSAPSIPEVEPSLTLVTTPELVLADVAEPLAAEPAVVQVTEAPVAPGAPVEPVIAPAPAPSVFARRPAEPVPAPAEPKVSFATAAKDLLTVTNPTPRTETPVTFQRPSVEEMTRAALEDLVGGTGKPAAAEERATAFAKPSGAFSKPAAQNRPRTIAPPPPDPQPIAAGPKLGAAPKRIAPPAPAAKPDPTPAPAAEPQPAQPAPPQGFEGLQFPNDGVLTRQWMEFLNQMAAGK